MQCRRSVFATVRIQVPEVWPAHGKNRERLRAALEKVPALRRKSGSGDHRACDPIQRSRLVRHGLWREKAERRRRRKNRQARGRRERSSGEREGKIKQRKRHRQEGIVVEGIEREKASGEKIVASKNSRAGKRSLHYSFSVLR